jgi:hypothetical protein
MEDRFSVPFLCGLICGQILAALAVIHYGWQHEFVMVMLFVAGFVLGALAMEFLSRASWYDKQDNLATRYRKAILASMGSIAFLQLITLGYLHG